MDCALQSSLALQLPHGSARAAPRAPSSSRARLGTAHALGQAAVVRGGRAGAKGASASSTRRSRRRGGLGVRAAAEDATVGGPLAPESPSGQLLRELIQSHPHLVPSAAEKQLELLAKQLGEEGEGEGKGVKDGKEGGIAEKKTGSDLVLYKRIEEVRKRERQRGIEEVIYSLIVQRFIESGSPLLPKVPFVNLDPSSPVMMGMVGGIPSVRTNAAQLEAVHSPEVLEMVQEHLGRVLGSQSGGIPGGPAMEDRVLVGTSKMRLGQVYAASIMYGYFLRRVDQRFQLEKGMQLLLGSPGVAAAAAKGADEATREKLEAEKRARMAEFQLEGEEDGGEEGKAKLLESLNLRGFGAKAEAEEGKEQSPLRAYVSSFDAETLQNAVVVRSREGITVVERHTEALFGKPEVIATEEGVGILKDDQTHITVSTLRRLILEAVAFGNFLWDVETYVDSLCKINARS